MYILERSTKNRHFTRHSEKDRLHPKKYTITQTKVLIDNLFFSLPFPSLFTYYLACNREITVYAIV